MVERPQQLELMDPNSMPPWTAPELQVHLQTLCKKQVKVTATNNQNQMFTFRETPMGSITIRLHKDYLSAPQEIRLAIRDYCLYHRKKDWKLIADYADQCGHSQTKTKAERLKSKGEFFDLKQILDEVNAEHFSGRVKLKIGWGRQPTRKKGRRSRSIVFGSYHRAQNLIRIHPAMDREDMDEAFIRYVIFHEMLHDVVPSEKQSTRTLHHPPNFKKLEKQYPEYNEMKKLSKKWLDILTR